MRAEVDMREDFGQILKQYPIIASIKDDSGLNMACVFDVKIVFILYGNILTLPSIVKKIKSCGKIIFVHIDLIDGLDVNEASTRFIKEFTHADGIITTKSNVIRAAKEVGLLTIQRFFLLDSMSLEKAQRHMESSYADAFEILPGVIPKMIHKISSFSNVPIIAGGLIIDKNDIYIALDSGAKAISTTNTSLWNL